MHLTRYADYTMRLLIHLAVQPDGMSTIQDIAKRYGISRAHLMKVANQAVQLFGGMGYMAESEIERQYRDMRILGIGGGTTEIMTSLAAKTLGYQA